MTYPNYFLEAGGLTKRGGGPGPGTKPNLKNNLLKLWIIFYNKDKNIKNLRLTI